MKGGGNDGPGAGGGAIAKSASNVENTITITTNSQDGEDLPSSNSTRISSDVNNATDTDSPSAHEMASMSGFAVSPTTTGNLDTARTAEREHGTAPSTMNTSSGTGAQNQSMPGAHAVPGINSINSATPEDFTTTSADTDIISASAREHAEQMRRLSSRTRLQVLQSILSSNASGGTDVVVAEATLVLDAEAVRASQASPNIPIPSRGDELDGSSDDDGGADEEIGNNNDFTSDNGNNNNNGTRIRNLATGEDETHATGAAESVPTMVTAIPEEEFMHGKHIMSRRAIVLAVAGFLVLLGIAVGMAVPLSRRNRGSTEASEEEADLSEVLTYAPEAICYSHIPLMTDLSRVCTDPSTLPKGGPFCQLVTDGILAQLQHVRREQLLQPDGGTSSVNEGSEIIIPKKVDMVITNAGAQRGDILPASNVTLGTIRQNLPFLSNRVVLLEVSPFVIHQSLEGGLNYTLQTIPIKVSFSAGYPYAANLRFDIDLTQPYGQRVTNMETWSEDDDEEGLVSNAERDGGGDDLDSGRWIFLDPTDTTTKYIVASNSYLAGGGDQYFPNVPDEAKMVIPELGFTDVFADYCRSVSTLLGPDLEEMSTQNFVPLDVY